jgi:MFS transporter, PPP family, 3-phenylpropionic acid transporter
VSQTFRPLAVFFASYFSYVGLFSPYLSLWLNGRGFSPAEIGVLVSPLQWTRVIGPPFWGWLADRASAQQVPALLRWSAVAALAMAGLLVFDWSFWALFFVLFAMSLFLTGQVPIAESLAMQTSRGDLGRYGRVRVWGSVGFIGAVLVSGWAFDQFGIGVLPIGLMLLLGLVAWSAGRLPKRPVHDLAAPTLAFAQVLAQPRVRGFLLASFLMLLAHAPLYTLFSLWLEGHGYSRVEIGLLWTLGVVAEIAVFQFQRLVFRRWSLRRVWLSSYLVTILRFALIALSQGNLVVLIAAQLLHAVTFGLHHSASVGLVQQWFPAQAQARGQALYTMAAYGLGGSLGGILAGWLWEAIVPEASFWFSAMAAALGFLVAVWVAARDRRLGSAQMPEVGQDGAKGQAS